MILLTFLCKVKEIDAVTKAIFIYILTLTNCSYRFSPTSVFFSLQSTRVLLGRYLVLCRGMGKERLRTRRTCLLATMHSPPPPSLSLHSFQFTWEWNAAPPSSPAPPVSSSQWCQRCNWDKGQGERGKNLELGKNSRIPTLWKKERRRNKYVLLLLCVQVRLHYCCCCSCWSIEMHLHQTAIGEKKKKGLAIGSCWMEWRYQVNEIALASQGLRNTTWRHSKSVKFTFFFIFLVKRWTQL